MPSSQQNTAPVHEFRCTFTHDIKRKNAKRWKDGFLKFHTFNNRLLVYDEARNFVQSGYHAGQPATVGDGAALSLDIILVEVGAPMGVSQTDLSEVVKKRSPKRPWDPVRRSTDRQSQHQPSSLNSGATRNLKSLVSVDSPTLLQGLSSQLQAEPENKPPPSKRPRTDDTHKSILEILKTKPIGTSHVPPGNYSHTPQIHNTFRSTVSAGRPRVSTSKAPMGSIAAASLAGDDQSTQEYGSRIEDENGRLSRLIAASQTEKKQHLIRALSRGGKKVTSKQPRDGPEMLPPGLDTVIHRLESPFTEILEATVNDRVQDLSSIAIQRRSIPPVNFDVGSQAPGQQHSPPVLLQNATGRPDQQLETASVIQPVAGPPSKEQRIHIRRGHLASSARTQKDLQTGQAAPANALLVDPIEETESPIKHKKIQSIRIRARAPRKMLCQALEDGAAQSPVPGAQDKTPPYRRRNGKIKTPKAQVHVFEPKTGSEDCPKENMAMNQGRQPTNVSDFSALSLPNVNHTISATQRDYSHLDAQMLTQPSGLQTSNILPENLETSPQVVSHMNSRIDAMICQKGSEENITTKRTTMRSPLGTLDQRQGRARIFVTAAPLPSSYVHRLPRRHSSDISSIRPVAPASAVNIAMSVPSFDSSFQQAHHTQCQRSALRRHETIGHAPMPRSRFPAPVPHPSLVLQGAALSRMVIGDKGPWTSEAWDLFGGCPEELVDNLGWGYDN